jgi:hypothetical protein
MRKNRPVDHFDGWFQRRSWSIRDRGNTIPTASASQVLAIAQQRLSRTQRHFFFGPKNTIAQAVGDVHFAIPR